MLSWYIWSPCNPKQRTQYQRSSADHWHCKLEKWFTCWLAGVHVVPFEHSQLHWRYIFSQSDTTYTIYTEPYSRKFLLVQNFEKLPSNYSQEFFAEKTLKDTERQSKEASLCNNGQVFLLCGGLRNYKSIRTAALGEKLACRTEGFSTAHLDFDNFGVSLTGSLAICIVGWFCSTATI